jgi:glutamate formiminotransferase
LESVVNLSEGRDVALLSRLEAEVGRVPGAALLDRHSDADHHRSVFTLAGPGLQEAVRRLAAAAVEHIDLRRHHGAHPRMGAVDVVPFVALDPGGDGAAGEARSAFAEWAGGVLGLPCFFYGPERSLPEVRRKAFTQLAPDAGPDRPHPTAGAVAVGVREPLVAYNLWLAGQDLDQAQRLAAGLRVPGLVRALAFPLGSRVQLSFNLLRPLELGPAAVLDRARDLGARVEACQLVGLLPAAVLQRVPPERWEFLDLSPDRTIEERVARRLR